MLLIECTTRYKGYYQPFQEYVGGGFLSDIIPEMTSN